MNSSTGIETLFCPQCRRKNLKRHKGTVTVQRGKETKEIPTDFASCEFCGTNSVISDLPFGGGLVLTECYFKDATYVKLQETPEVSSETEAKS